MNQYLSHGSHRSKSRATRMNLLVFCIEDEYYLVPAGDGFSGNSSCKAMPVDWKIRILEYPRFEYSELIDEIDSRWMIRGGRNG